MIHPKTLELGASTLQQSMASLEWEQDAINTLFVAVQTEEASKQQQEAAAMSPIMERVWYAVGGILFGFLAIRMVKRSFI